jgi:hypothetical protein
MELQGHTIKRGSAPRLEWQTGIEIPSGSTVRLRVGEAGLPAMIEREPDVLDASLGHVALQFTPEETARIGDFDVDLSVTTAGGQAVYYPNAGFSFLRIIDRVEDIAAG